MFQDLRAVPAGPTDVKTPGLPHTASPGDGAGVKPGTAFAAVTGDEPYVALTSGTGPDPFVELTSGGGFVLLTSA